MKRMVSKIFCVIMALCVFLGAMPIASFAEDGKPDGFKWFLCRLRLLQPGAVTRKGRLPQEAECSGEWIIFS